MQAKQQSRHENTNIQARLTAQITKLLYELDPAGLKPSHVPCDEYLPEAEAIVRVLDPHMTAGELSEKMYHIFVNHFAETVHFDRDMFGDTAAKILAIIRV